MTPRRRARSPTWRQRRKSPSASFSYWSRPHAWGSEGGSSLMSEKRRGLGRGLGALIPSSGAATGGAAAPSRPVDLFFPEARRPAEQDDEATSGAGPQREPATADASAAAPADRAAESEDATAVVGPADDAAPKETSRSTTKTDAAESAATKSGAAKSAG